jgi:hypothetical protein
VQDDRGTPIGDASVTSEPDGYEARTLADGSFVLLARPGTYALTVARDGYESATAGQVAVIQGQSSRLGLSLPSRLSPTLRNASFEAADLQGWTSWGDVDGARDGPWFFGIGAQDGGRFLGTAVNCGAKDGGVQQAVAARPGAEVTLRAWTLTYRDGAAGIRNRVGIDPRGGSEPGSASVVWSPWLETAGRWESLSVNARAESDRVTVFLEHDQDVQNPWNLSAFDGVELIQGP